MISIGRDYQVYVNTYPTYNYTGTSTTYLSRRAQSDSQYPTALTQSYNRANIQLEISLVTDINNNNIVSIPNVYSLSQNYPNPFNPVTKINYELRITNYVSLKVYDALGKEVANLVSEIQSAGSHDVVFNGNNFASGVYFYRLESGDFKDIRRMVLIK
ncbi:MAG: T9SS type A sorting domain-containing protein [Ignavibacteria bacterium]|nr:T9SS type A sorting domain-containing protein [Ignavibacteria bacterium]